MKDGKAEFDRFEFVIWLGDVVKSSEQRKLELALRYCVQGQEMWDNNGGGNYVATISRVQKVVPGLRKTRMAPIPFSDDELSDLLEKAAAAKKFKKSRRRSPSPTTPWTPTKSAARSSSSPPATTTGSFNVVSGGLHTRTRSFPFPSPSPTSSGKSKCGWMERSPPSPPVSVWPRQKTGVFGGFTVTTTTSTTLGSPRDFGDDAFHPHAQFKFPKDENNNDDENKVGGGGGARTRRHHRGGYFDLFFSSSPAEEEVMVSKRYDHLGLPAADTSTSPLATPTPNSSSSTFTSFPALVDPQRHSRRELWQRHVQAPVELDVVVPVENDASTSCGGFSALEKGSADRDVESTSSSGSGGSTEASMENDLGSPSSSSRSSTPPSLEGEEEPTQELISLESEEKTGAGGGERESYGELLSR